LVLGSIASVQFGAAIAKNLFGTVSPTTLVWFRLLTSAVVLLAIVRLGVRGHN
jgi:inner membrane transporter RhtA